MADSFSDAYLKRPELAPYSGSIADRTMKYLAATYGGPTNRSISDRMKAAGVVKEKTGAHIKF